MKRAKEITAFEGKLQVSRHFFPEFITFMTYDVYRCKNFLINCFDSCLLTLNKHSQMSLYLSFTGSVVHYYALSALYHLALLN